MNRKSTANQPQLHRKSSGKFAPICSRLRQFAPNCAKIFLYNFLTCRCSGDEFYVRLTPPNSA
ncbi:MAG: hypothetical protein C5B50_02430 [Verrucomicrobia bacterium]|nr:MAG: hypothetical protein C5B50_02430 [Verrucomicrobiota bacterium]